MTGRHVAFEYLFARVANSLWVWECRSRAQSSIQVMVGSPGVLERVLRVLCFRGPWDAAWAAGAGVSLVRVCWCGCAVFPGVVGCSDGRANPMPPPNMEGGRWVCVLCETYLHGSESIGRVVMVLQWLGG